MQCNAEAEITIALEALLFLSTSGREPKERQDKVDLAAIREIWSHGQLSAV